jgi:hypothetical protein
MKTRFFLTSMLGALALVGSASAQAGLSSSGTLGVTATVQGSINLTFLTDASGLAMTGTGTSTASLPFGNVSMYAGTVPANVTKTRNGITSFDLSTPFDVRVDVANTASPNYILTALLATADAVNTWSIGATNISAGVTASNLTSLGEYTTAVPYTLTVRVPASAAASTISNSIGFTANSN